MLVIEGGGSIQQLAEEYGLGIGHLEIELEVVQVFLPEGQGLL